MFDDSHAARTKDNYKFSSAKDPLFNSTGFCKVEDHCRQEHDVIVYLPIDIETVYITRVQKTYLSSSYLVIDSSRKHYVILLLSP